MPDIDELATRAGAALRDDVARTVDPDVALRSLHARRVHRRRVQVAGALAVGAAAAVTAVIAGVVGDRDAGTVSPAPQPTPAPYHVESPDSPSCKDMEAIRCLRDGIRVAASTPYTLRIHGVFDPHVSGFSGATAVDVYRTDTADHAGVTFLDDVVPGRRPAGLPAEELATWVAARPYLEATEPRPTTVGGLPARELQVLAPDGPADAGATCNGSSPGCWPLIGSRRDGAEPWETGPHGGMLNSYLFVDLPSGATFAIWSWSYTDDWADVDDDQLIRTIRWGTS